MRIFLNSKLNTEFCLYRRGRLRAHPLAFLALSLLASLIAACGAPRPVKYYQLSYPMSAAAQQTQINVSVLVRTFDSSVLYKDNRIVYATSPQELGLYEGQRWVNRRPLRCFKIRSFADLRASGHYRSVMSVRGEGGGEYSLGGSLYEFCEYDGGSQISARLNYVVRLQRTEDRTDRLDPQL